MSLSILLQPIDIRVETEHGWKQLTLQETGKWSKDRVVVELAGAQASDGAPVHLWLESAAEPVLTVKIRWAKRAEGKLLVLGDHWERAYGDLEWRGIVPERVMPWYFLTNNGSVTNGYGVRTGPSAFCSWKLDQEGITFTADVRNGAVGVLLGDRRLEVAVLLAFEGKEGESAFAAARRFCQLMCLQPVLPSQPVYGGNNWYYAYGNSSHKQILADSAFISSLASSEANRPFMVIDDGWQLASGDGGCKGAPWTGSYKFPDMAGLARAMKETGVRPGIWCRPLMSSDPNVPKEWVRYSASETDSVLDPTVPGVLEFIAKSIKDMSDWGFELIKHDFSTYDLLGEWGFRMKSDVNSLANTFSDRSKTTAEIVLDLYRTIAEASDSSLLIGCNTISHLAAGLFEIQRTGDDTSGKSWERTRYMGVNTMAFRMAQHNTFYSHDADCIGITKDVPWELNKQWLDLLAGSGTPLFVSVDPAIVTEEQEAALRAAFDLASQELPPGEPHDWMETTCPSRWLLNGEETAFEWSRNPLENVDEYDNEWWL
jgi:alpha-galactosidase